VISNTSDFNIGVKKLKALLKKARAFNLYINRVALHSWVQAEAYFKYVEV
jgi:hypothetical protein